MKKKLNQGILPLLILTLVASICTGLLALTNELTMDARQAQIQKAILASQQKLFPEGVRFEEHPLSKAIPTEVSAITEVYDGDDVFMGLLIKTASKGYAGPVPAYVAYDPTGAILGLDMPSNTETAGLGQKVRDLPFYGQFVKDFTSKDRFTVRDQEGRVHIDAISGATISSNAVVHAINQAGKAFDMAAEHLDAKASGEAPKDLTLYLEQLIFETGVRFEDQDRTGLPEAITRVAKAYDQDDAFLGTFMEAKTKGHNDHITVHLGYSPDGQILAMNVPHSSETGFQAESLHDKAFHDSFIGKDATARFSIWPEGDEVQVDAVSGATTSADAVVKAINLASEAYLSLTKEDQ